MDQGMLFVVGLVFDTPEYGTIVVGANEDLDELIPGVINEMIGDQILIRKPNKEEQVFKVISMQINHSIAGKKNIGICLGKEVSPESIPEGSLIYHRHHF